MPDEHQIKGFVDSLSDAEVKDAVNDFRLSSVGANLTKQLKEEWRECVKYCAKRRIENWRNRKLSSTGNQVQGLSGDGVWQEEMRLPTIAELDIEKRFGKDWHKNKTANKWAWDKYPQFRLIEKK